ncbi:hypothetical protein Enr13x_60790 [Stieleria neptunia]|uniref:UPF0235 protein Enr13x_60790 n=1 Tax=Stieleria neptunia TaxID=2527979 RepID=A0A518HZ97_9BACT|nr:DUF167 domain-containing protein [Stieleria neptunia]QDV46170.1 hypothetical protein Enr13x_60790 [Stieleria neptunia]
MNERLDYKQIDAETLRFRVRVTPGAKKAGVGGSHDGALKVAVHQAPENGKANQAVVKAIAKQLGISKSRVVIVAGETVRVKSIEVSGSAAAEAIERLTALASSPLR